MVPVLSIIGLLLGGLLAAGTGVAVIWWALFRDKARGRRRCPRCWHDLAHTPGLTCGECGYRANGERDLLRTRRRWRVALAALVAILAVTLWTRLTVTQAGWESLMPNVVLVGMTPLMEPASPMDTGWRELTRRVWRRELATADQLALAERLAAMRDGDAVRTAPAELLRDVMRRLPGELDPSGTITEAEDEALRRRQAEYALELDQAIAEIPLALTLTLPKQSVEGAPLTMFLNGFLWGQRVEWRAQLVRARATPVDGGAPAALHPLFDGWVAWNSAADLRYDGSPPAVLQLEGLPPGPHHIEVSLRVQARRWDWATAEWGPWLDMPEAHAAGVVNAGAPLRMVAVDNDELRESIRAAFENPAVAWTNDERPIGVRYNAGELATSKHSQLLIGVVLELCEQGEPRRRSRFWWQGGRGPTGRANSVGWAIEYEDLPALRRLREDQTGWTIRVRGDLPTALRAFHPNSIAGMPMRYWNGTMEFPLHVERQNRAAPERIWRYEPTQEAEATPAETPAAAPPEVPPAVPAAAPAAAPAATPAAAP